MRLHNELQSCNLSAPSQNCLQIVLHNLESLIETYRGVGPSTQVVFDMMHRRRASVIGIHAYNEVKSRVNKKMALSIFDLQPEDKKRLKIARFNDPNIAPHIYEKFLYAYGKFQNNNEVLQYFVRILFTQF